ncbi:MAG TPA: hypothetical protein VK978_00815 [Candidatus Saccharimonadales bacterium]|nr:hypothetical protein [Candidatus Saccharimonadales bacterium]
MNSDITYQLRGAAGVLSHFPAPASYVRDGDDKFNDFDQAKLHMQARIRSGDYFGTLATELERIAQSLDAVKAPEAPELERIVTELLYVGQNYGVVKK